MNDLRPASLSAAHIRLLGVAAVAAALAACAATPTRDPASARVRADLSALQSNPELATKAPIALQNAERAVELAERPDADSALTAHRVYVADRKVQTAKSLSLAQAAIEQRKALSDQTEQVRLEARTREADLARNDANRARQDASAARVESSAAQDRNDALLAELADLKAKKTDRGVQITLGDVLFSSGRAELQAGAVGNLDKLVLALQGSADRKVVIEGFTDSQGSEASNQALSQRRADAVSGYLSRHGVDASRLSATGRGKAFPVAGNEIPAGRQLNRRVEVTIENPVAP